MKRSLLILSVLSLAGCAPAVMTPLQNEYIAKTPTCSGKDDCELKWARVTKWLGDNSHWKLRNVTDAVITTEGPLDTVFPAFQITKFPKGGGAYEIDFEANCGAVLIGCSPSVNTLHAAFNHYVDTGEQ